MKKVGSNRNNNIGILHFVGALFVLYGHEYALLCNPGVPVVLNNPIQSLGVKSIFVISGYLISKSLWKAKNEGKHFIKSYFIKRVSRIYPELFICLVVTTFVIGPIFSNILLQDYLTDDLCLRYIILNILMFPMYSLPGLFEYNPYQNAVNGSLWTMPVEIVLYVIVLFLGILAADEKKARIIYTGFTVFLIAMQLIKLVLFQGNYVILWGTDWLQAMDIMPYFMIGATLFFYSTNIYNIEIGALLFFIFSNVTFSISILNEFICMLILPYFILSLGLSKKQGLKVFRYIKPEYSYGLYLWGFPIQQVLIQIFYVKSQKISNINVLFVISVFISYIVAAISYNCIFLPVKRLLEVKNNM